MGRNKRILSKINVTDGRGLELGPLTTPIVDKSEGNIFYVDHMSTADLKKKYAKEPVDPEKIVNVDYVLKTTLKAVVGNKKFDYVLASHVIEHVPDMVRWLDDIFSVLKPGGILSLVIPDKRYTFDITRQVSSPADVIGAYIDHLVRPNSATMYDFASEYRQAIYAGEIAANPNANYTVKEKRYTDTEAFDMAVLNASGKEYVDSHCLVFTPHSFFEIIKRLINHGLINFEVVDFYDTVPGEIEFFVSLRKTPNMTSSKKLLSSVPDLAAPISTAELQIKVSELEQQVHNILTSSSWRITKPLRRAIKKLSRN